MKENILDKYALNQLNSEEEQWIKNALAKDPGFQQELNLHQNMVNALIKKGAQEAADANLKATISQIEETLEQDGFFDKGVEKELIQGLQLEGEKELFQKIQHIDKNLEQEGFFEPKKSTNTTPFIRLFAAAASIVFVLSFAWYYSSNSTVNYQQEYAAAFEQYDNTLSKAVQMELSEQGFGGNPDEEALQEILIAMETYDNKKYTQAIILLQKCLEKQPSSTYQNKMELYLGLSYLESNKIEKAITQFQSLSSKETANQTIAEWYLALAYLKAEKIEQAKTVLNKLKNTETNLYQKKATTLLQKLS
ncbi:MAG: tetratricopeptide repeat protein [Aureispira sp.]|nr:tetratricopeptide repeat protein [Aureispira sp.]